MRIYKYICLFPQLLYISKTVLIKLNPTFLNILYQLETYIDTRASMVAESSTGNGQILYLLHRQIQNIFSTYIDITDIHILGRVTAAQISPHILVVIPH